MAHDDTDLATLHESVDAEASDLGILERGVAFVVLGEDGPRMLIDDERERVAHVVAGHRHRAELADRAVDPHPGRAVDLEEQVRRPQLHHGAEDILDMHAA